MTTYRNIHGRAIQSLATDPTESVAEGQIWYNTSSDTFKSIIASKAFVSSTSYPTAVFGNMGAGTQTAALSFGGTADPSTPSSPLVLTMEYNGSGWANGGDMSQKRRSGFGFGTQTAALGSTGYTYPETNKTEHYNGTSWTNGGNYPASQELGGGCGTQTAGLACGGGPGPSPVNISNEYDGSSWTASPGTLNTARKGLTVTGIQTAGLAASSADSPTATACEEYNGSTWTTVNSMNTSRANTSFGSGIQTASILYGTPGSLESYDGTNWTNESATMANARNSGSSAGTATASLAACGSPGAFTSHVEEYNQSINVITAAAWAAGPALGTGRYSGVSGGTTTAAIFAGGGFPRSKNETELYDGTSWSEVNNMNSGRGRVSGTGTPSSAVGAGGYTPSAYSGAAEQWDGTNWSNITSLPASRQYMGSIGASGSAALFIGGNSSSSAPSPAYQVNETLYWNGSSWATGGNYPNTVWNPRGFGTITAGISCGGNNGPNTSSNSYNGSSWTSGPSLNIARDNCGASGATDSDGLIYGGGSDLTAEKWDGTSFATSASFANTHNGGGSNQNGSSSTAMVFGNAPNGTAFEEFTAETTSLNVKTLTQS